MWIIKKQTKKKSKNRKKNPKKQTKTKHMQPKRLHKKITFSSMAGM